MAVIKKRSRAGRESCWTEVMSAPDHEVGSPVSERGACPGVFLAANADIFYLWHEAPALNEGQPQALPRKATRADPSPMHRALLTSLFRTPPPQAVALRRVLRPFVKAVHPDVLHQVSVRPLSAPGGHQGLTP